MWTRQGPPCLSPLGHQVTGLDGSTELVALASAASNRPVLHQDILDLDLPTARFDGIFAYAALFHVPGSQIGRILADLAAALKSRSVLGTTGDLIPLPIPVSPVTK